MTDVTIVPTATIAAKTAPMPPPLAHWFRVRRQRSQRIVFSWGQFMSLGSGFEPAEFGLLVGCADHREERVFQRAVRPQLVHRSLVHQLALGDDAHVRAQFLDNLE